MKFFIFSQNKKITLPRAVVAEQSNALVYLTISLLELKVEGSNLALAVSRIIFA